MTIAPVNLGSFYTNSSGQSVSNGISSGLNTQSVIAGLTAAQSTQITQLNDQITVNNSQASALGTLQQILSTLQKAASTLSDPQSPDNTNNIWAIRTTNITSNTTQAASNYLTATVASGTATGTYTISNITQLAKNTVQESGTFASVTASVVAATATTGQFTAGTLVIENPNGQTSASVTLNAGDNLTKVAQDFNAVSSVTGIQASVLETASGVYALAFTSTASGTKSVFDLGTSATVTANQSLLSNISFSTIQTGQDAQFKFNNIAIDRPANTVNDLVSGVTLNLLQDTTTSPGANFNLQIAPDTTNIAASINAFANAYNNFVSFYTEQTQLNSSGTPASSAVLYNDTTLRNIYNTLSNEVASAVPGISSSVPNSLAGVGLTLTQPSTATSAAISPNIISVDISTLESELQSNFSAVENVFGYNLTSSSPNLILFQSSNKQTTQNFNVSVNQTATPPTAFATYTSVTGANLTVNFTTSTLSTGGVSLTGPTGSALDGLQMLYLGSDNPSGISVSTTQGIADLINNELTTALQTNTGLIANDQTAITAKNTTIQKQITTVTAQESTLKSQLLQKYSALEAAINKSNSVLALLNANQLANSAAG